MLDVMFRELEGRADFFVMEYVPNGKNAEMKRLVERYLDAIARERRKVAE